MSAEITLMKTFAALPQAVRGKPVKITGDPKGENFVYCSGQSVFIRNIEDPCKVDVYTEHAKPTTVARYSPSRFYIASADQAGKVRIWDTVNPEHILKAEYPALGREICDLDWSPDNQKIVVAGNGSEKFAHVFSMDTGTSVGEVSGHSKPINTCSYRPARPFRIVTASEDTLIAFHEGPPFKFKRTQRFHTNFVNVARFSHNGEIIVSGGADGKLFKYDGKTCDELGEIGSPAHKGGIYDLCFSPDDKQLLTVSGDKTAKIFDVETGQLVQEFVMGSKDWQDMQLGCLWQGDHIITINARGHLIYHNREIPEQPNRIVKGHMKPITALAISEDKSTLFTGGQEGIIWWDVATGQNDVFGGQGHTNEVTDMVVDGDNIYSVGKDDTLRVSSVSAKQFTGDEMKLDSQPQSVDAHNGTVIVSCLKDVVVLQGTRKLSSMPTKSEAVCVSIHPQGSTVAVAYKNNFVGIYSLQGGALSELKMLKIDRAPSVLAFSPDGAYLAVSIDRAVSIYNTNDYQEVSNGQPHTARVTCMSWAPSGQYFATGSIDCRAVVWKNITKSITDRPTIKAHTMSYPNKVVWINDTTFVTAGQDSNVKIFNVPN